MKVHPQIAALRAIDGSQRSAAIRHAMAAEAIKQDWLARIEVARINDELARYAEGADLADCQELHRLLTNFDAARDFVTGLTGAMVYALRAQPLIEVPFRYKSSRGLSTVHLLAKGRAVLALSAYEPVDAEAWPATAVFSDRCCTEMVISGTASGMLHQRTSGSLNTKQVSWCAGDTICSAPLCETRQILKVERSLIVLQLIRDASAPRSSEQVSLKDGRVLRKASGDKSASQAVMALGVLGALQSSVALDVMAQTALNHEEDLEVRWEAVRQSLSIDAARGLALLRRLQTWPDDALSLPAEQLAALLLATHRGLSAENLETV